MLTIEAAKMGYRVATFSPDSETPTGQIAWNETAAPYDDLDRVAEFAKSVDVITFEFENIPAKTVEAASQHTDVFPGGEVLHTTQNRLREKTFLSEKGFPVANYKRVKTIEDLFRGSKEIGLPAVLKTAGFGYDGKGQRRIVEESDIDIAYEEIGERDSVLEKFIPFEKEISVVGARGRDGEFVHYGAIENDHVNHILDMSFAPADVSKMIVDRAVEIASGIAEEFDYVGTLCVEFFLDADGDLLVNEIARGRIIPDI